MGWEIRPLGWILLAVIVGIVIYMIYKRLRPPQKQVNRQA